MVKLNHYMLVVLGMFFVVLSSWAVYFFLKGFSETIYPWEITDNYTQTYDCKINPRNLKACEIPIKVFVDCVAEHMVLCEPLKPWLDYDDRIVIVESFEEANLALKVNLNTIENINTGTPFIDGYFAEVYKSTQEKQTSEKIIGGGGKDSNGNYSSWTFLKLTTLITKNLTRIGEIQ